MANGSVTVRRHELSAVSKNSALGTIWLIVGGMCILLGIPLVPIIIGVFIIMGGLLFVGMGMRNVTGTQAGACPYCDNPITVGAKDLTFKCPHCKKISTRKDEFLESIE